MKQKMNFAVNVLSYLVTIKLFNLLYVLFTYIVVKYSFSNTMVICNILFSLLLLVAVLAQVWLYKMSFSFKNVNSILKFICSLIFVYFLAYFLSNYFVDLSMEIDADQSLSAYGLANIYSTSLQIIILLYFVISGIFFNSKEAKEY